MLKGLFLLLSSALLFQAAEYPESEISNGQITAKLHLPDPERGSYHGTRFDWSGIIYSLQYKGHEYFGRWYERHDPKIHDAITGPVEEFLSGNSSPAYDTAQPGGTFVRIGVGTLRKPEDGAPYQRFRTYEIVDAGKWTINPRRDQIEFIHELQHDSGYAYRYRKLVRLTPGKPQLVLEHALKNTGRQPIDTMVYDHNFFVIDNEVVGPDVSVQFPFDPKPISDLKGLAEVRGREIVYLKDLEKGQSVQSEMAGFSAGAKDYDLRIENRKSGAGVRISGDQPIAKLIFWSIRTVACPEPYLNLHIEPGQEQKWQITYDFYTLPR